jgi:hypothetical protein
MVDHIQLRHKGKCIETIELCKDERLKQMDMWENNVVIILFIGRHLKAGAYDVANIDRVKN